MPMLQQESDLARFVARRAHLSTHLLDGLRGAIGDLGRPDLVQVVDLVRRNMDEAYSACAAVVDARRLAKRNRIQVRLIQLAQLGDPKARRLAKCLTEDLSSGFFPSYGTGPSK